MRYNVVYRLVLRAPFLFLIRVYENVIPCLCPGSRERR